MLSENSVTLTVAGGQLLLRTLFVLENSTVAA